MKNSEPSEDPRILIKDIDQRQLVPLTHLVVVEIMGGGDLNAAGTEGRIDILIGNNRNLTPHQRQADGSSNQVPITLIVRVNRYRRVAQHSLRARCCDH